jgi:hypothetical protein
LPGENDTLATTTTLSPLEKLEKHPISKTDGPLFDRNVLRKIPRMAIMHLQRGILQGSWIRLLVPYIRLINVLSIVISVYSMYTSWYLMQSNQKLAHTLSQIQGEVKNIQSERSAIPISLKSLPHIQSIWENSRKQSQQTSKHWTLLEHLLMDRCLVGSIGISPKKTRISLRIIDPTMSIEDLIDMGKNAFPLFNVIPSKSPRSRFLILETNSPFVYEKITD